MGGRFSGFRPASVFGLLFPKLPRVICAQLCGTVVFRHCVVILLLLCCFLRSRSLTEFTIIYADTDCCNKSGFVRKL